uniref:hypothetical protein n=1 Tax=Limnohabitans sp. TaxID=1907725 RepID=UPI0040470A92
RFTHLVLLELIFNHQLSSTFFGGKVIDRNRAQKQYGQKGRNKPVRQMHGQNSQNYQYWDGSGWLGSWDEPFEFFSWPPQFVQIERLTRVRFNLNS